MIKKEQMYGNKAQQANDGSIFKHVKHFQHIKQASDGALGDGSLGDES